VLNVNSAQSNITMGFDISASVASFSDSGSSPLSGTANLTGLYDLDTRKISQVQITSLDMDAVNNLHFHDTSSIFTLDAYANNLAVKMDASGSSHPAGPSAVDASGNFSQGSSGTPAERNVLYGAGALDYAVTYFLGTAVDGSMDLSPSTMGYFGDTEAPIYFTGIVAYNNSNLFTLSIPSISVIMPVDEDDMTGTTSMVGVLVATASDTIDIPYGDTDLDSVIDGADFNVLLTNWGAVAGDNWAKADFDGDNLVDGADFNHILTNWGAGGAPLMADVPEPATMTLLVIGGVALIRRRK